MPKKTKFGFGSSENISQALEQGLINARDILLLDEDTNNPKIGWVDKNGNPVILKDEKADLSEVEADVAALEAEIVNKANAKDVIQLEAEVDKKADAAEVNEKIGEIETALDDVANASHAHEKIKFEIADVPVGTLVNYRDGEIRICCSADTVWTKQTVGEGGDANTYYCTLKTYAPNGAVGYIEHLGSQVDEEILIDLQTDAYGRRYQPSWLGLAKYDVSTDTWTYYGADSTSDKMRGWNYQIDWYDANNKMIASDSVRINLSNKDCHFVIKPYYGASEMTEVETKIDEAVEGAVKDANAYTDSKIADIESAYEIVEF